MEEQPVGSQPIQPQPVTAGTLTDEQKIAQYSTAIADIEQKNPNLKPKPKMAHHFLVMLFLLIFPPVSFLIMWKYKDYHGWFASICWVSGVFLLIYTLIINYGVVPQIQKIITQYGSADAGFVSIDIRFVYLLLAISVLQIIYGWYLRVKFKRQGDLPKLDMALTIVIMAFGYFIPGMVFSAVVTPIYNSII